MNITDSFIIATFIMTALILLFKYIDGCSPHLKDILVIACTIPCYQIIVYKNGKRLKYESWIKNLNNSVEYTEFTDGILYITIS